MRLTLLTFDLLSDSAIIIFWNISLGCVKKNLTLTLTLTERILVSHCERKETLVAQSNSTGGEEIKLTTVFIYFF